MSIVRWEPFPELMPLRRAMDRLFEESFIRPTRLLGVLGEAPVLPIDMYQTANEVVVKTALPGVDPEDIDISITGDTLTISGEIEAEEEVKKEDYICQECRYGAFSRSVLLPSGLKTDKAEATFEHGVLTLTIPKAEEIKRKSVKVKAKAKAAKEAVEGKAETKPAKAAKVTVEGKVEAKPAKAEAKPEAVVEGKTVEKKS